MTDKNKKTLSVYYRPYDLQKKIHTSKAKYKIVCLGRRALALDTLIPVYGKELFKTVEDIEIGDVVFDEHGKKCNVVDVTPIMLNQKCYKVIFSDGSEIIADAGHQWQVTTHKIRKNQNRGKQETRDKWKPIVVTTEEMVGNLHYDSRGNKNYQIQAQEPIDFNEQELPIDPYIVGLWLGDGSCRANQITCHEDDYPYYRDYFNQKGVNVVEYRDGGFSFGVGYRSNKVIHGVKGDSILPTFRELQLYMNKHIPKQYLQSSIEQRKELLRGLMDSDGFISANGLSVEFYTTSTDIRDGVKYLLSSLGIIYSLNEKDATLNGKYCGICYRFNLKPTFCVFNLPRKVERWEKRNRVRKNTRIIKDIVEVESVPVKCISVDSPNNLFLCGESFIPTHNSGKTTAAAAECINFIKQHYNDDRKVTIAWIAPTYSIADRGVDAIRGMLKDIIGHGYATLKGKPTVLDWDGHKVHFLSCDREDGIRGWHFDLIICDESAFIPDDTMYAAIMPTMADTDAPLLAISTPNGPNGWFYDFAQKDSENFEFFTWSSYKNPYVSDEVLNAMAQEMPKGIFQQEIMAEFVADNTSIIQNVDECHTDKVCECNSRKIVGLDLAKKNDYTVAISLCPKCGIVTDMNRFNKIGFDEQVPLIKRFYSKNNAYKLVFDVNSIGEAIMDLAFKGSSMRLLPFKITASSKKDLINSLVFATEQGDLKWDFNTFPLIKEEISTYRMEITKSGHVTWNAQAGKNDDVVIALALASTELIKTPKHEPFVYDSADAINNYNRKMAKEEIESADNPDEKRKELMPELQWVDMDDGGDGEGDYDYL